jgi:hypothetical protein
MRERLWPGSLSKLQSLRCILGLEISHNREHKQTTIENRDTIQLQNILHAQRIDGENGLPYVAQDEEPEVDGYNKCEWDLVDDREDPVEV